MSSDYKTVEKYSSSVTDTDSKESSRELNAFNFNEEEKSRHNTDRTKVSLQTTNKLTKESQSLLEPIKTDSTRPGRASEKSGNNGLETNETIDETKYYINYEGKLAFRKLKSINAKFLDDDKVEIVSSILEMIFSKFYSELDKISHHSITPLKSSLPMAFHSTKFVPIKERIKSERKPKPKRKERVETYQQNGKNISKTVQYLGLPINVAKPKRFLDTKIDYNLVLSEKANKSTVLSMRQSKADVLNDLESFKDLTLLKTETLNEHETAEHIKVPSPFVSIMVLL